MKFLYWILFLVPTLLQCSSESLEIEEKIKGASFVAPSYKISDSEFDLVKDINANWVALMPYSYVSSNSLLIKSSWPNQWWGESYEGIKNSIIWAKQKNLKILIKPHIWFTDGTFNGDFKCDTENQWLSFEESYKDYLMKYAKLSDSLNVDAFCIGVELKNFVKERPQYWIELIKEVKKVYSGDITYAANWDNYKNIPFWSELDFIGIDAYFPLSSNKHPSLLELQKNYNLLSLSLSEFSLSTNKPIAFTEYGFRSSEYCCNKPWEHHTSLNTNYECQEVAYQAFFNTINKEPWFLGGFFWKWFASNHVNEESSSDYSPQNKPVYDLIKKEFSK